MEFIDKSNIETLTKPGVFSKQLISLENSASTRVTITEVYVGVGAIQPRHAHDTSEQIWYALKGEGMLLLDNNIKRFFTAGDVVRFSEDEIHGLENCGMEEFVYISVTSPPLDFGYAYEKG